MTRYRLFGVLLLVSSGAAAAAPETFSTITALIRPPNGSVLAVVPLATGVREQHVRVADDGHAAAKVETNAPVLVCALAPNLATQCRPMVLAGNIDLDMKLDGGRSVTGRCFMGREPARDARVYFVPANVESRAPFAVPIAIEDGGKVVHSVVTSRDGRYEVSHLAPGEYFVEAHLDGGLTVRSRPLTVAPKKRLSDGSVNVPDLIADAGVPMKVDVRSSDGEPIDRAGVAVSQRQEDRPIFFEGRTEKDGTFLLRGLRPASSGRLTCVAEGYARTTIDFDVPPPTATCTLERLAQLHGRVVDVDGHPISSAAVSAGRRRAESGSNGSFRIDSLAAGMYAVSAVAPGFAAGGTKVEVIAGGDVDAGTIELSRGNALSGRVVDDETGSPIAGASVAVVDPVRGPAVTTDEDGLFHVEGEIAATTIEVRAPLFAAGHTLMTAADGTVVRLARSGSLEVTAWDEKRNTPCVPCRIDVSGGSENVVASTDDRGFVRFERLAPGRYAVSREMVQAGAGVVTVSGGGDVRFVTVKPRETAYLRIGTPARRVTVTLDPAPDASWHLAAVSAAGMQSAQMNAPGQFVISKRADDAYTLQITNQLSSVRIGTLPSDFSEDSLALRLGTASLMVRSTGTRLRAVTVLAADGSVAASGIVSEQGLIFPFLRPGLYSLAIDGVVKRTAIAVASSAAIDLGLID